MRLINRLAARMGPRILHLGRSSWRQIDSTCHTYGASIKPAGMAEAALVAWLAPSAGISVRTGPRGRGLFTDKDVGPGLVLSVPRACCLEAKHLDGMRITVAAVLQPDTGCPDDGDLQSTLLALLLVRCSQLFWSWKR